MVGVAGTGQVAHGLWVERYETPSHDSGGLAASGECSHTEEESGVAVYIIRSWDDPDVPETRA